MSIALVYNCPGSSHDAMNAKRGGLEEKLDALPMNFMLVSDTAFSVTHMKVHRILQYPKKDKNFEPRGVDSEIKSVRQCAEWGVGAIAKVCPRLDHLLVTNNFQRKRVVKCMLHFYQFRVHHIGRSQIATWVENK
tara:strand:+ start:836 stop:1240 length:405 start_codon:yes stop_codon:yes gene_type:complete